MKTLPTLIALVATAIIAQATAVAQPMKFRSLADRNTTAAVSASANETTTSSQIQHQHRRAGSSPRTYSTAGSERSQLTQTEKAAIGERTRVGPRSKVGTVLIVAETESVLEPREAPRRSGPVAQSSGRR